MKNIHPIEVAILITALVIEAAAILIRVALVPMVALVLTLAQWRPAAPAEAPEPAPIKFPSSGQTPAPAAVDGLPKHRPALVYQVPQHHPLALLAAELEALPATTLRAMAGVRSKRHTKRQLIAMVAACS